MIKKIKTSSVLFINKISTLIYKSSKLLLIIFKNILDRKTILFVSKNRIKSYSIGTKSQLTIIAILIFTAGIFTRSFTYDSRILKKSAEIDNLKKTNEQFKNEVNYLNSNLQKINNYFSSTNKNNSEDQTFNINNKDQSKINSKINSIFGNTKFTKEDKKIADKIADSSLILDNIKLSTAKKINDLEQKISITGIALVGNKAILTKYSSYNIDNKRVISLNDNSDLSKKQGGPFLNLKETMNSFSRTKSIFNNSKLNIEDNIKRLSDIEKFIEKAPLIAPIKDYYVSSVFGKRSDPIRKSVALHEGMDFVGKNGANIISPSAGKVIFAGKFSTYGNALIIDHGYGITTRYGHLAKIYVEKGSYVKRNQIIALQGNTGRSTGSHLHYEVRHNNIPLNPKNFLLAGQQILALATNKF